MVKVAVLAAPCNVLAIHVACQPHHTACRPHCVVCWPNKTLMGTPGGLEGPSGVINDPRWPLPSKSDNNHFFWAFPKAHERRSKQYFSPWFKACIINNGYCEKSLPYNFNFCILLHKTFKDLLLNTNPCLRPMFSKFTQLNTQSSTMSESVNSNVWLKRSEK